MIHLLATFDSRRDAHNLIAQMVRAGIAQEFFSISDAGVESFMKQGLALTFAMLAGIFITLLIPNGHLAHLTFGLHLMGVAGFRLALGAATGGAIELLLQKNRRTSGRYVVVIEADWPVVQRSQRALQDLYAFGNKRLQKIVRMYGYEHQSFLALYGSGQVWFSALSDAAVVYHRHGKVALVTAAPVAAPEQWAQVTREFLQFCAAQKMSCLMLPLSTEFAQIARACGMGLAPVGASGYFCLRSWKPAGDRAKKVRAGINQARGAGLVVTAFDPVTSMDAVVQQEIEALCQLWLNSREINALAWLLELSPFKFAEQKRYFLARDVAGKLIGLLACSPIPARNGWYLEDLLRHPDAPRGVSELLVVEALRYLAAEGAELATLGTSPLANLQPQTELSWLTTIMRFIYDHSDSFYHFKQLHRFKTKFAPSFVDAEYAAFWPPRARWAFVQAALQILNPTGLTGVIAAKARKFWQRT